MCVFACVCVSACMILPKAPTVRGPQHGRQYMQCCFCGIWHDLMLLQVLEVQALTAYCRVRPHSFPKESVKLCISSVFKLG